MTITKEELLDKLNGDLAWEYAALLQYVQHASVITGAEYESIVAELLVHANEEMQHAINLSDQIDFLGGVPAVDVQTIKTSGDSKEMLEQDLESELDAIARYKGRIAEAEDGLRRVLEDTLIMEEEHARPDDCAWQVGWICQAARAFFHACRQTTLTSCRLVGWSHAAVVCFTSEPEAGKLCSEAQQQ
jgi:bacterioferritin